MKATSSGSGVTSTSSPMQTGAVAVRLPFLRRPRTTPCHSVPSGPRTRNAGPSTRTTWPRMRWVKVMQAPFPVQDGRTHQLREAAGPRGATPVQTGRGMRRRGSCRALRGPGGRLSPAGQPGGAPSGAPPRHPWPQEPKSFPWRTTPCVPAPHRTVQGHESAAASASTIGHTGPGSQRREGRGRATRSMLPRAGGYETSPKHPPVDSLVLVAATGLASWAWLSRHKWPPLRTAVVLVVAFWAARAAMTGGAGVSLVSHLIWGTPDPRLVPLAAGIAPAVWVLLRKRRRQAPSEGRCFDWRLWGKDLAWGLGMWGICELAWAAAFPPWSVLSLPHGTAAWASPAVFALCHQRCHRRVAVLAPVPDRPAGLDGEVGPGAATD